MSATMTNAFTDRVNRAAASRDAGKDRHPDAGGQTDLQPGIATVVRRSVPRYQLVRLMCFCGALVLLAACYTVAPSWAVGTVLVVVSAAGAAGGVVWLRCTGRWARVVGALRSRPWRGSEEILDVAAAKLPDAVRRTLNGGWQAPSTVAIVLDPATLLRVAREIGIGQAEAELTLRYAAVLTSLGAAVAGPARVVVHGSPANAPGEVRLAGRCDSQAVTGTPDGPTRLLDEPTPAASRVRYQAAADEPAPVPPVRTRVFPEQDSAGDAGTVRTSLPAAGPCPRTHEVDTDPATQPLVGPAGPDTRPARIPARTIAAQLVLTAGQRTRRFRAPDGPLTIGRSRDCTLVVPEPPTQVSRLHAVIRVSADGSWVIEDRSTNGTFVNGNPVRGSRILMNGDVVVFGRGLWTVRVTLDHSARVGPRVDIPTVRLVPDTRTSPVR